MSAVQHTLSCLPVHTAHVCPYVQLMSARKYRSFLPVCATHVWMCWQRVLGRACDQRLTAGIYAPLCRPPADAGPGGPPAHGGRRRRLAVLQLKEWQTGLRH